ncbi:MAG TPA: hypothetical protein VLK25_10390 [Allosphingosinicella sp.]|nr:hypothetical protein [Allosphingosinicella sp.]
MANRLIRYDATLFRRSLADAFQGKRDILLLLLLALIGFAWLRDQAASARTLALPPEAVWWAALAGPAGFGWQRLAGLRLAWLTEHSALAPAALDPPTRGFYLATAHLLVAAPCLAGAALLGTFAARLGTALGLAAAAYALGAGLASITPAMRKAAGRVEPEPGPAAPSPRQGRRAVIEIVLRRQVPGPGHPLVRAGLVLAGNFTLTLCAGWWGTDQPETLRFAAALAPSLATLLLASRFDAAMLGFLPYAGYRPAFIASAVSALPAASLAVAAMALLVIGPTANIGALSILVLVHLGFILVGIARSWLYPGRQKRAVDLQLQLEFAGLAAIAMLLPPLAVAAAGWRFLRFHRHCGARLWIQS